MGMRRASRGCDWPFVIDHISKDRIQSYTGAKWTTIP